MFYDRIAPGALDYCLYRFGHSKNLFRGPKPDFTRPYIACLGSSETYGKFVETPYPQLLQADLGLGCANFSALNAGVEMYLRDPSVLRAALGARVVVVAVMGAHNMSNRFYSVHPRRNDRFVRASGILKALYSTVDFSEIHYTRHLLTTLQQADAGKFAILAEELKTAWLARMKTLLEMIEGRIVLLWMSNVVPPEWPVQAGAGAGSDDPLFIDQKMLDALGGHVTRVVECVASPAVQALGTDGMIFERDDREAARHLPGPAFHQQVAAALAPVLRDLA